MPGPARDLALTTDSVAVRCNPETGTLALQLADHRIDRCSAAICLEDGSLVLSRDASFLDGEVSSVREGAGVQQAMLTNWRLGQSLRCLHTVETVEGLPALRMRLQLVNEGPSPVKVQSLRPLVALEPDTLLAGTLPVDWVLFRDGRSKHGIPGIYRFGRDGARERKDVLSRAPEDGEWEPSLVARPTDVCFRSEHFAVLRRADRQGSLLVGFTTLRDQFCQLQVTTDEGDRALLGLEAICQNDGVLLPPGAQLSSEWLWLDADANPFAAIDRYADRVALENQVRPSRPATSGWCSWYFYYPDIWEEDVLENVDFVAAQGYPMEYAQIDEGWNDRHGDWEANEKFPHGMRWLAEQIRARGMRPGIWIAPFLVHKDSRLAREHPDWLLRDREGRWIEPRSSMEPPIVDPTIPGVQDYLHRLGHRLVHEWGYDYVKADFIRAVSLIPGVRFHGNVTRAQAVRLGMEALREGMGPDAFLLACGGPYGPTLGLVDGNRTGADTAPEWKTFFWGARQSVSRWYMNGRWWMNDCDNLCVRDNTEPFRDIPRSIGEFSEAEVQTAVTVLYLSGGLALVGERLPMLSDSRRALLDLVLPPLGVAAVPRDLFESRIPTILDVEVAAPYDTWHTIGVVNWDDEPRRRTLRLGDLADCDSTALYHVYEFWSRRYYGRLGAADQVDLGEIPEHGCCLLLVKRVEPTPQLVSTNAHLSQGAVEIGQWEVGQREMGQSTLTISAGKSRVPFGILVYVPEGWNSDEFDLQPDRLAWTELAPGQSRRIAFRRDHA